MLFGRHMLPTIPAGDLARARAGASLRCLGLTQDDPAVLSAAAKAYARGCRPLEQALACEDAGTGFAGQGRADQARPLLEQALEIYERLRAARDLARAEAALRDAGIRRGRRGPRSRPQFGWPSLTPTERQPRAWSPMGYPTRRSARGCTSPAGRCKHTWRTCSPSWTSTPAPSSQRR